MSKKKTWQEAKCAKFWLTHVYSPMLLSCSTMIRCWRSKILINPSKNMRPTRSGWSIPRLRFFFPSRCLEWRHPWSVVEIQLTQMTVLLTTTTVPTSHPPDGATRNKRDRTNKNGKTTLTKVVLTCTVRRLDTTPRDTGKVLVRVRIFPQHCPLLSTTLLDPQTWHAQACALDPQWPMKSRPHKHKERVHRNNVTFHNRQHDFKLLVEFKESLEVFPFCVWWDNITQILDGGAVDQIRHPLHTKT